MNIIISTETLTSALIKKGFFIDISRTPKTIIIKISDIQRNEVFKNEYCFETLKNQISKNVFHKSDFQNIIIINRAKRYAIEKFISQQNKVFII